MGEPDTPKSIISSGLSSHQTDQFGNEAPGPANDDPQSLASLCWSRPVSAPPTDRGRGVPVLLRCTRTSRYGVTAVVPGKEDEWQSWLQSVLCPAIHIVQTHSRMVGFSLIGYRLHHCTVVQSTIASTHARLHSLTPPSLLSPWSALPRVPSAWQSASSPPSPGIPTLASGRRTSA